MTKQARPRTDLTLELRKEHVLSLHATGASERRIAEILGISKTTVHNTLTELRAEAIASIEDIIESLPLVWRTAVEATDALLRRTVDLLDSDDLEVSDRLSAIKLAGELSQKRLDLHSSPQLLQRIIKDREKLKAKLEQLQKSQPRYEVSTEVQQSAGKPAIITKTLKRVSSKKEEGLPAPVV